MKIEVFQEDLARHRKFYLFEGALLVVLGMGAILLPAFTALAFNIVVAVALILGGIGRLATWSQGTRDRVWKLLGGLLLLITGLLMFFFPEEGIAVLVLVLGALLVLEGVLTILMARFYRGFPTAGWLLASGVLSLLLGITVLFFLFPAAGIITLAVMLGLSLIMSGLSVLVLAWNVV